MPTEIDRREFVRIALMAIGALTLPACNRPLAVVDEPDLAGGPDSIVGPDAGADSVSTTDTSTDTTSDADQVVSEYDLDPALPSLGGAPETANGRVVAAFCDTIIPSAHRDPMAAPGALEANVPALFFDARLPAAPLVPLLVSLLNAQSQTHFGARFDAIAPFRRIDVVERSLALFGELEFAIQLVKLGYFSSPQAATHLGYPGSNAGYRNDPDLTYDKPLTTPHPLSVAGNIP
ncbi:MAG: hypothetical protein KC609_02895 [Myxococcales bacterium]|nr:hypothetical protein [Myxococcales bacterium]